MIDEEHKEKNYDLSLKLIGVKMVPYSFSYELIREGEPYTFNGHDGIHISGPYVVLPEGFVLVPKHYYRDDKKKGSEELNSDELFTQNMVANAIAKKEGGVFFPRSDGKRPEFSYSDFVQALKWLAPNSNKIDHKNPETWANLESQIRHLDKVSFGYSREGQSNGLYLAGEVKSEKNRQSTKIRFGIPSPRSARDSDIFCEKDFGFVGKQIITSVWLRGNIEGTVQENILKQYLHDRKISLEGKNHQWELRYCSPGYLHQETSFSKYYAEYGANEESTETMLEKIIDAAARIEAWNSKEYGDAERRERDLIDKKVKAIGQLEIMR